MSCSLCVYSKVNKANGGMAFVMCGIDEEGDKSVFETYADDMRDLEKGIKLDIPNDFSDRDSPTALRSITLQVNEPVLPVMNLYHPLYYQLFIIKY